MIKIEELIGQKFGHLTIIGDANYKFRKGKTYRQVTCECDCKDHTIVIRELDVVRRSNNGSCGCERRKPKTPPKPSKPKPAHGWNFIDLKGQRFGKLTVLELAESKRSPSGQLMTFWKCRCDCGKECIVRTMSLRSGNTKSCGCGWVTTDADGKNHLTSCKPIETHNKTNTRLYRIYRGMITRCYNESSRSYKDYGGRGIKIDPQWYNPELRYNTEGFLAFYNWSMENGYRDPLPNEPRTDWLSIDRVDNDGPYAPWNCRWVGQVAQANNQRTTRKIEINGEKLSFRDAETKYNLPHKYINNRLESHWSMEMIIYSILHQDLNIKKHGATYITATGDEVTI